MSPDVYRYLSSKYVKELNDLERALWRYLHVERPEDPYDDERRMRRKVARRRLYE